MEVSSVSIGALLEAVVKPLTRMMASSEMTNVPLV